MKQSFFKPLQFAPSITIALSASYLPAHRQNILVHVYADSTNPINEYNYQEQLSLH